MTMVQLHVRSSVVAVVLSTVAFAMYIVWPNENKKEKK